MTDWYVSLAGAGGMDGTSLANAWDGLANVVQGAGGVLAGDTLNISGTHTGLFTWTQDGAVGSIITWDGGVIDAAGANRCVTVTSVDYLMVNNLEVDAGSDFCTVFDTCTNIVLTGGSAHDAVLFSNIDFRDCVDVTVQRMELSAGGAQHGCISRIGTGSFSGVTYSNNKVHDNPEKGLYAVGASGNVGSNVVIENNKSVGNGDGIYLTYISNAVVRNNICLTNTDITQGGEGYGIALSRGDNVTISDNHCEGNRSDGFECFSDATQSSDDCKILRNIFKDQSNADRRGVDFHTNFSDDAEVVGNVFIANDRGLLADGTNTGMTCAQNTFYEGRSAIRMENAATTGWSVHNNIMDSFTGVSGGVDGANAGALLTAISHNHYRRTGGTQLARHQGVAYTEADITSLDASAVTGDPKMIDPANGDFRLNGGSPCIGTGTKWWAGLPPRGQDGLRFPLRNNKPDMGAYAVRSGYDGAARSVAAPTISVLQAGADIVKGRSI